jgi:hypothetical protein
MPLFCKILLLYDRAYSYPFVACDTETAGGEITRAVVPFCHDYKIFLIIHTQSGGPKRSKFSHKRSPRSHPELPPLCTWHKARTRVFILQFCNCQIIVLAGNWLGKRQPTTSHSFNSRWYAMERPVQYLQASMRLF